MIRSSGNLTVLLLGATTLAVAAPAHAFFERHKPPSDTGQHYMEYGYTSDRPYYHSPGYGYRRYYRSHRKHNYFAPVYVEPSYRFTYGYPWSYPSYGYVSRGHPFP